MTIECGEGEVLSFDAAANTWACQSNADGFYCPGDYSVACPDQPVVPEAATCKCDGELLVDSTCQSG